jgi:predicted CopG family antitoxin
MEKTTIAIRKDIQESIKEFGNKGESYSDIILKLIKSAKERQLHDLLLNEDNTISIEEARKELNKKWPKLK